MIAQKNQLELIFLKKSYQHIYLIVKYLRIVFVEFQFSLYVFVEFLLQNVEKFSIFVLLKLTTLTFNQDFKNKKTRL
jgi:hypothetical protein